ncbi:MAG: hypothetical protein HOI41_13615, partial [Acidimicrobiaceae bacterium]|nr:hypothetical protein [Acidimicrobiaceae bacterium]
MLSAYCWPQSAKPGETIDVMVSSDHGSCTLEIVRLGAQAQVIETHALSDLAIQPI